MKFFDIFWYESDLTQKEKDDFVKDSAKNAKEELEKIGFIVNDLPYKCPKCLVDSKVSEF